MRFAAFFILTLTLSPVSSFAKAPAAGDMSHCLLDILQQGMARERSIEEYDRELSLGGSHQVSQALKELPEGAVWMNIGTGQGFAESEVISNPAYQNVKKIVTVDAVHIDTAEALARANPKKLTYYSGKTLQESVRKGPLKAHLKKVDYLTDLFSATTYSPDLKGAIVDEISLLKIGGKAQFNVHMVKSNGTPYLSLIIQKKSHPGYHLMNDAEETLRNWFSRVKGAKVTVVGRTGFNDQSLTVVIERTGDHFEFPELIPLGYDNSRVPPVRTYLDPNQ